eukprot:CAMPEP_0169081240 /NCGR_PEP_ID=MMETSP1015-20121227/10903_1 /TAXON_ID=342587 /ORGANISM="Karlodinium micrum, Strain CCMP2283" /LENGTH=37 /DNA_ID= /DNA_START= /DNA_END= /DNA_ORIENTATION=
MAAYVSKGDDHDHSLRALESLTANWLRNDMFISFKDA